MTTVQLSPYLDAAIKESFPISRAYPMPTTYAAHILPSSHPWAEKATTAMARIKAVLDSDKTCVKKDYNFPGFFDHVNGPGHVLLGYGLPFVIKIFLNEKADSNCCIKRVLIAERLRKFCQEYHLDRICIPEKFLVPRHGNQGPGREMSDADYAVVSEKMPLPDQEAEIWESLSAEVRAEQKRQVVFLISALGFMDGLPRNIVLLKDGRFCFLDTDEPRDEKVFSLLLKHAQDNTGFIRDLEIENAKFGLFRHLQDCYSWEPSENSNDLLYYQYMSKLERERFSNIMHRACRNLLKTVFFVDQHCDTMTKIRIQNLKERVYFAGGVQDLFFQQRDLAREVAKRILLSYTSEELSYDCSHFKLSLVSTIADYIDL